MITYTLDLHIARAAVDPSKSALLLTYLMVPSLPVHLPFEERRNVPAAAAAARGQWQVMATPESGMSLRQKLFELRELLPASVERDVLCSRLPVCACALMRVCASARLRVCSRVVVVHAWQLAVRVWQYREGRTQSLRSRCG